MKLQNRKQAERTICGIQACPTDMKQKKCFIETIDVNVVEIQWQKHVTEKPCDPCFRATLSVLSCNFVKLT